MGLPPCIVRHRVCSACWGKICFLVASATANKQGVGYGSCPKPHQLQCGTCCNPTTASVPSSKKEVHSVQNF